MKKRMVAYRFWLLVFAASGFLFFASCSTDDSSEPFVAQYLSNSSELSVYPTDSIRSLLDGIGGLPPEVSFLVQYGVKVLKLEYKTVSADNQSLTASGALLLPQTTNAVPLVSFQHGTITNNSDAPSSNDSEMSKIAAVIASAGYILCLPDYIGYGSSQGVQHAYEHRQSLAVASRDMLRAGYEYLKTNSENFHNGKLFLTGYSEGGFATMAMFKLIEGNHSNEFQITAVSVGAGAYNKTAFAKYLVNTSELQTYINSFVWVLMTYNSVYSTLNHPMSYYFNSPFDQLLQNNGPFVNLESNPQLLFTQNFLEGVKNDTETGFLNALADNDCYNWKPVAPLKLYHGTNDDYVPYFNSETAYEAMHALGGNVELVPINGGSHSTSVETYLTGTLFWFQSLSHPAVSQIK